MAIVRHNLSHAKINMCTTISDVAIGLTVIDGLIKEDIRTIRRLELHQQELTARIKHLRARVADNTNKLNRLYESGRRDLTNYR